MLCNKFFLQTLFQSAQHFYEKREQSEFVPLTNGFGFGRLKNMLICVRIRTPTLVVWFYKKLCNFQVGPGLGRDGAGYWWRCASESAGQLHWPVHPADQGGHGEDRGPGGRCRDQQGQPAHHVPGNNFLKLFCVLLFEGTCTSFSKIKSRKEVTKQ